MRFMMYLVKGKDDKERARFMPTETSPAALERKIEASGLKITWRDEILYPGVPGSPGQKSWAKAMQKLCGSRRRGVNSRRHLLENIYLAGRLAER